MIRIYGFEVSLLQAIRPEQAVVEHTVLRSIPLLVLLTGRALEAGEAGFRALMWNSEIASVLRGYDRAPLCDGVTDPIVFPFFEKLER